MPEKPISDQFFTFEKDYPRKEWYKRHYAENKEIIKAKHKKYRDTMSRERKDEMNAWRNQWRKDNKSKVKGYCKKSRLKHLNKRLAYGAKYRARRILFRLARDANKRFISPKLTAFDLYKIVKKQKLICPLTGRKLIADNISLDHILPASKGGTNDVSNIRLIDFGANMAKHTLDDVELLQLAKDIVKTLDIIS